ncbi:hypothetical protein RYH80_19515 [Halobaculum sp. MBLA0147]|uniref:hypothetical protein n=1 Tax=Halobaculum sp. MBLA0147 TaxID=3079934 RepID=UPI003525A211
MEYQTFDDEATVKGVEITSISQAARSLSTVFGERAEAILAEHDLGDIDPDQWYPLQHYLDAIQYIDRHVGSDAVHFIAKEMPELTDWPDEVRTVVDGMNSISGAYSNVHRGDVGYYEVEQLGERSLRLSCRNPYPCVFDRGIIRGVGERFTPPTAYITFEEQSAQCRRDGGDECIYDISW